MMMGVAGSVLSDVHDTRESYLLFSYRLRIDRAWGSWRGWEMEGTQRLCSPAAGLTADG